MGLTALAVDPVLARIGGNTVSLVFLWAGWQKLRDLQGFQDALGNYAILPAAAIFPVARLLPMLELGAALAVLTEWSRSVGAVMILSLLAATTGAVVINLMRGRHDIDCGCGSASFHQPLSWWLVLRNVLLAVAAVLGAQGEAGRELVWMDDLTVALGSIAGLGLYASGNQLLANHPRLIKLGN